MEDREIIDRLTLMITKYALLVRPVMARAVAAELVTAEEIADFKAFTGELQEFQAELLSEMIDIAMKSD